MGKKKAQLGGQAVLGLSCGGLDADDDVAEKVRSSLAPGRFAKRKRKDVGALVVAAKVAIEVADFIVACKSEAQLERLRQPFLKVDSSDHGVGASLKLVKLGWWTRRAGRLECQLNFKFVGQHDSLPAEV